MMRFPMSDRTDTSNFGWIEVYQKLADRLLDFKNNRKELISIILQVFAETGLRTPSLSADDNNIPDICPFSFLALFNKGLTNENRKKLLSSILKHLGLNLPCPDSFDGIPVLTPQMATFYWFTGRGESDIDNLWDMYEAALQYADFPIAENRARFCRLYDTCQTQKGVKWNLSMGFYWMRPLQFLSLDGRNRWYIETSNEFPSHLAAQAREKRSNVPDAEEYLQITTDVLQTIKDNDAPYTNFVDFSYHAWLKSEEENKRLKEANNHALSIKQVSVIDGKYIVDIDISKDEWIDMLQNEAIFYPEAMKMVLEWYKRPGHQASNKEITDITHPESKGTPYNGIVASLGRRIIKHLNRFEVKGTDGKPTYWIIPFNGWYGSNGNFIWKVRDELAQAIAELELINKMEPDALIAAEESAPEKILPAYSAENFLAEVFMSDDKYQELRHKLLHKKNIILQGAPGVGKTFISKRLAWSIMGCEDTDRVMMIQFHQSYGYEDFIMGYRPSKDGFELKTGPFYNFCKKAAADKQRPYFFIIDEINRGNLSKIFGELFMLMESDKREEALSLLYTGEQFSIPDNLHIIGMMNTADRSLAMLDYALRRRFAFFELSPAFQSEGFKRYAEAANNPKFQKLLNTVTLLNEEIERDESLGRGFRIGHSYFYTTDAVTDEWLHSVVHYELIPLLEEYWFDSQETLETWRLSLLNSLQ